MPQFLTVNNFNTTLVQPASATTDTLSLATTAGLPNLATGQAIALTLQSQTDPSVREICYITAVSNSGVTVDRAQEGTSALSWNVGDIAYCALTAGSVTFPSNPSGYEWEGPQTLNNIVLQSGAAGAGNETPLLNTADAFSDFIASGMQWAIPTSASLTTSMSSGVAYLNGVRTLVPAVSGYSFPASNDTYVSSNNSGVIDYQSVANGATAPTPNSGYVQTAKVVTSPIVSPVPTITAGAILATPTAVLTDVAGGSLAATAYYVTVQVVSTTGQVSSQSEEVSLAVDADYLLVVDSPSGTDYASWSVNVSTSSGAETVQASGIAIGTNWTEPTGGLIAGATPPAPSMPAGTYTCALVANDATGYGAVSASVSVTVPLNGSIAYNWVNPLNETSMDIYATTEGGTTLGLVASGVTGTSYTYTGSAAPGAAAPTTATSNAIQNIGMWRMTSANPIVIPQSFGAYGDGIHDDTSAIQQAVNAVGAQGGGQVFLPPTGSPYLIAGQIVLPNGVSLNGVASNFEGMSASNG